MSDVHDKATRSKNMRAIRSKDTKPELLIRSWLHKAGLRFRLHRKDLPGQPDLVFSKYNAAIFVHGCFWHGHDCHLFKLPRSRTDFWRAKINSNSCRDARNLDMLRSMGWRVLTVWECSLKGPRRKPSEAITDEIIAWLKSDSPTGIIEYDSDGANQVD